MILTWQKHPASLNGWRYVLMSKMRVRRIREAGSETLNCHPEEGFSPTTETVEHAFRSASCFPPTLVILSAVRARSDQTESKDRYHRQDRCSNSGPSVRAEALGRDDNLQRMRIMHA